MRVLVTGGAGFVGAALVERLAAEGHRVTVLDDCSTGDAARVRGAAALVEADIACDDLAGAYAAAAPETVFHLAARTSVAESVRAPCRGAAVNVGGTVRVLRQSLASGARRFVFASSGGALYGDAAPRPTPEDARAAPCSPYGVSKAAGEGYVRTMSALGGMRHTILRYGNVYGPGGAARPEPGVVDAFAAAMLGGAAPAIHGDGLDERDYVYIDDVVEAHLAALAADVDGAFNVASGEARTVCEVFGTVARATGFRGAPGRAPAPPGQVRRVRLDVGRAGRELGWTPGVGFEEGVARTVRAMRGAGGRGAPRRRTAPPAPASTGPSGTAGTD